MSDPLLILGGMDIIVLVIALVALAGAAFVAVAALRRQGPVPVDHTPLIEAQSLRIDRLTDALTRAGRDESDLRGEVGRTREVLEALRTRSEERQRSEEEAWGVVRRLEAAVLGGGQARGRAGENLVHAALADLPASMVVRDFRVNGSVVEFALVLPDGRRLPVDSKWTALREVEAFEAEEDPIARDRIARDIEKAVVRRACEVAAYLDADLTTPFAVACVPDAAFAACRKAHGEAFARNVVLVPYSTALPTLLSLYALAAKHGGAGDVEGCLSDLESLFDSMERTLENKVARATTMLQTAADEFRSNVGKARGAVARGRGVTGETVTLPEPVAWPPAASA